MMMLLTLLISFLVSTHGCNPRDYGKGSIVCVCTKNDCDTLPPVTRLSEGKYVMYTSSKAGARFNKTIDNFSSNSKNSDKNILYINRTITYQTIFGYGGAFTDSTGINLLRLSNQTRDSLIRSYFSKDGLQYSMGRIPIAGTDFSTRPYTYDDVTDDTNLTFFALQQEDHVFKIPFIRQALELTGNDLKLFGSAWSAPSWMKTNHEISGFGFLKSSYYDIWAEYHIKFLEAYYHQGIKIWGLTTGNEPADGYNPFSPLNDMGWVPTKHARWIAENLGPKIRKSETFNETKIMIVDDQRLYFPWVPRAILKNKTTRSYVDGSAVHIYTDTIVPASVLTATHNEFPDKFIFASEASVGNIFEGAVILGSWDRAESYLNSILDDMNNWVTGWMDWNMALDPNGGPTYINNNIDSPIIINKTSDEFYKQPMYYALGHFSKFVRPKAVRIESSHKDQSIKCVVFQNPDDGIVAQIYNPSNNDVPLTIRDENTDKEIDIIARKRSINTVMYW